MCGSPKPDPAIAKAQQEQVDLQKQEAERRRREEEQRQQRIQQGMSTIDDAFGQFGDDFYGGFRDTYVSHYQPDIRDQYMDARERLTYQMADAGNLQSAAARERFGDLEEQRVRALADISGRADDAVQRRRAAIEQERRSLVDRLNQTADPNAISVAANNAVQGLQGGPQMNPLGPLFQNVTAGAAQAATPQYDRNTGKRRYPALDEMEDLFGRNSGRVIR